MKPSERIKQIVNEIATKEWVNDESISDNFHRSTDFGDHLLKSPIFCIEIICKYLDEQYEKSFSPFLKSDN